MADNAFRTRTARGPVVLGYDGSSASRRAVCMTATILAPTQALVVTVWEPAAAYQVLTPTVLPAPIDIRVTLEVEEALYESARHTAEQGAALARELGFDAEGLAVVDTLTVANTLVRLAREHDASAVVVGSHGHRGVRELLFGSTTRDVIRDSPCPVCVVRDRKEATDPDRGDES